ncbi:MAG: hypothetical protein ACKO6Q_01295 [Bacteroidota bacterium]
MERAALKQLIRLEEAPSDKHWLRLSEELDQAYLRKILYTEEANPPAIHLPALDLPPRRTTQITTLYVLLTLLLLAGGYWLFQLTENTVTVGNTGNLKTPTSPQEIKSLASLGNASNIEATKPEEPDRNEVEPTSITPKKQKGKPVDASDYILVARTSGQPMRIPVRWKGLSCCLSGENKTAECDLQKDQWHQEVLCSELGFHADPLLGLLSLMDSPN